MSLGQFPHDIERFVSFLGLQAVDREDDLINGFVLPPQRFRVLLAYGEHDLVIADVAGNRVVQSLMP